MNLKTAYEPYFKIGAAINRWNLHTPAHMKLLLTQFSSFTCENDMKPMYYLDKDENKSDPAKYNLSPALNFEVARPYLEFARANGIAMRGHTLVWHNQTPKWFFCVDYNESKALADRDTILARLESYIKGVLEFVQTEYPGVIYAWDVVNECVDDGGFRKSVWSSAVGEDFFIKAFEFARKYAAPGVALFYNDYETSQDWKRDFIIESVLKPLMEKGLVDGMGLQSHLLMDHPDYDTYRTALEMYGELGLQIQVTELDIHNADPSESSMHDLALRYRIFFEIYLEAKKSGKANITSVTFWNLLDENSWLTGFRRETSYPMPRPEKDILYHRNIWESGEYTYEAAYGFEPNVFRYLHTDDADRDCMLVVPGGGYCMCVPHEGELVANEFYRRGMNVFVLSYTTDITMSVPLGKQPLNDISRAVRYIRKNAKDFRVDGKKLFICGFSAGAHVCGSLAVHFDDTKDINPEYDKFSNRPDGVILSYPVITTGEYTHIDSVHALLGFEPTEEELEYFSLEKQVKENTPPCFIWQTLGDGLVPVENSYLFAEALRKKKIPYAQYVFPAGDHGLSVCNDEQLRGFSGGDYTMEQCMRAVHSVREGKGVNVSEKRKEELIDQFFGGHEMPLVDQDESLKEDVGLWTSLAQAWMNRI